jgi:predicted nucleic-acid-binding protein
VRLLTADDPRQTEQARTLMAAEAILLPKTVLVETEWVLRRLYRQDSASIGRGLNALVSRPNLRCEDEPAVRQALAWHRAGMDFADALNLASSHAAERFVTFDRAFIEAARVTGLTVSEP